MGKREGRTREVRTNAPDGPDARARAPARTFRAPFRASRPPSFDVVKSMGEKGPRGAPPRRRGGKRRAAAASDARRGRREGGEARDDGLAGRRAGRARPRAPRAARGKGGKARMMAARKAADLGSRRVPSPFETCALRRRALSLLRSRKRALALLSGLSRVCSARVGGRSARAAPAKELSFPP